MTSTEDTSHTYMGSSITRKSTFGVKILYIFLNVMLLCRRKFLLDSIFRVCKLLPEAKKFTIVENFQISITIIATDFVFGLA